MSFLEDIQNSAIDATSNLGEVLRKCKLLAARLDNKPLENWLLWESNGYPDDVDVPEYRIWELTVKGNFAGPFQSGIRNAPIPISYLPEKIRNRYRNYKCRLSIDTIEATIKDKKSGVITVTTGELSVVIADKVYTHQTCIQAWAEFSSNHLVEVLSTVRNRILDFTLAVGKEYPGAGDQSSTLKQQIDPTRLTQIFNTTIYGGSANLVGSASGSTINFNIVSNDFSSVKQVLIEKGVQESDLDDLKLALESEVQLPAKGGFGPKVSAWIGQMMKKAADGTWKVALDIAGTLLSQVISKYYGL